MSLILSGSDGVSDIDGSASTPAIRGTDANTGIFFGTDVIGFSEGGVQSGEFNASGNLKLTGNLSVGGATPATSGSGITFPATASASSDANTLDDYEEGSWTPSLGGNTTYSVQNGTYTKIGNVVFVRAYFTVSTLGTGSVRRISGLPFTTENPAPGGYVAALTVAYYDNAATSVTYPVGAVVSNNTILDMHFTTSAASGMTFTGTFFGTNTRVELSGCYRTA